MKNIAILFAGLSFVASLANAHHSSAGRYDSSSLTEVEGVVMAIRWRNPHAYLKVLVTGENGQEIEWEVERAGVTTLARSGLRESLFQVGDRVRVAGWSPVTARREMFMQNVLLSSGEEFVTWSSARVRWSEESRGDFAFWSQNEGDRSQPEAGLFRVWSSSFALPGLFNLSRLDTNAFPLTEAGQARVKAFEARGENLVSTQGCTPKGMPLMYTAPVVRGKQWLYLPGQEVRPYDCSESL